MFTGRNWRQRMNESNRRRTEQALRPARCTCNKCQRCADQSAQDELKVDEYLVNRGSRRW